MEDAVSRELEQRARGGLPWRSSLVVALALHAAVVVAVIAAPEHRKPLVMPSVQVRLGVSLPATAPAPASRPAARAAAPRPEPPRPAPPKVSKPASQPRKAVPVATRAPEPEPVEPEPADGAETEADPAPNPGAAPGTAETTGPSGPTGSTTGAGGGLALGGGGQGQTDEAFPFTYYLQRVLGLIEANWFRPQAPPGTAATLVRCRVDRSGRVTEAGIERPSGSPAFDRAALRAVYASAPLPPLPQAYAGNALTLHLEFAP